MKRNIISVVIGLIAAIAVFLITETINGSLHPTLTIPDMNDPNAVNEFHNHQPLTVWLMVLAGWAIGSFLCGLIIKLISKNERIRLPIFAGAILSLSAIANFILLPHPTWFIAVGLVVFIPCTIFGHRMFKTSQHGST